MKPIMIITGAAGFLGSAIANHLVSRYRIIGVDRSHIELTLPFESHNMRLPCQEFETLISKTTPTFLLHAAGNPRPAESVREPMFDFQANCTLTYYVLETLRKQSPKTKFIYLSSAAVYDTSVQSDICEESALRPNMPYGLHKLFGELLCRQYLRNYAIPTVILRPFSAYGPTARRQVIRDLFHAFLVDKNYIVNGTGKETRDFVHTEDLARAIGLICEKDTFENTIYNIATGISTSLKDLALLIASIAEVKQPISFTGVPHPTNPTHLVANIAKLNSIGYAHEWNLQRGIQSVYESLASNPNQRKPPLKRAG